MADIAGLLSQIMASEEGRQQVGQVLSALGQSQNQSAPQQSTQSSGGGGGGLDLSGLMSMLQNSGGGQSQSAPQQNTQSGGGGGGGLDLSGLMSMLQNSGGGQSQSAPQQSTQSGGGGGGGMDLSGLMSMLQNGGGQGQSAGGGLPNLDIGKLMRVQQLLSQQNKDDSSSLLYALKPHLSEKSAKKVDEAARILQLLNLLPLLKESGLFGSLLGGDES